MFPAHGYNNAYPHGRTQMPADHPNSEAFPPETKLQKPNPPFMYEPWPHHFGYPVPMPYHSCCNHSPYPGYYAYRPPYPHFPSPQPHPQYHEAYSLYPEPYPFHYAPPPQYFPGWNYNVSVPGDFHCRECPRNKSHTGEGKSVKIEEHEPEAEKHDSVVPAGFNNLQHPVVWIPPDYLKQEGSPAGNKSPKNVQSASRDPSMWNGWFPLDLKSIKRLLEDGGASRPQDQRNRSEVKLKEKKAEDDQKGLTFVGPQHDLKSDGGVPNIWNGWMPPDLDNIKRLLKNEELKNDQGHQPTGQKQQMPSPIIWLPYDKEEKSQMGKEEHADAASEASVQRPSNSHLIPVQQGDAQKQKTIPTIEAESDTKGPNLPESRGHAVKIIPVKQAGECADTMTKNNARGKCDDNAKDVKNNEVFIDDGAENKPVSPKRASKLPPVCLRVDPLPKKKNAKGSSRSPSPPGQRSERAEAAKSPSSTSGNNIDQAIEGPKDEAKKKSEALLPQEKNMDARKDETVENQQELKSQEVGIKPDEAHKPAHRVLSAVEAAILIQSAFRGYEVRRWEPLKKLRLITSVRGKAAEVRKSIESAPGSMGLKQRVALGETLMKLLLDLDTIQGLHPSVRDIRKSLASELVRLQERLDNVVIEQPNNSPEDPKAVENIAASDKSSMSSALTAADGQQGEEASKQVRPEKSSMQQIECDAKDEAAIENSMQKCQANEPCPETEYENAELRPVTEAVGAPIEEKLEKPVESDSAPKPEAGILEQADGKNDSHTTDEAPQMMSQQEAKVVLGAGELNNEELEAPEEVRKGEELETPIAEQEKYEPTNLSEGNELKEQDTVFPATEDASRESHVNAVQPAIAGESSCVELGEEPANNIKVEFEEPEENHPRANSRTEEPTGNPVENDMNLDEKMNEAEGRNQPSNVTNNEELDEVTEGQGHETPPVSEHEKHESTESEVGEGCQLEGDSQSQCMNEAMQDEKMDEVESKNQRRMVEENERMKDLVEKLIASGKQQQEVISNLNGKLKDLETKLAKQRRKKRRGRVQIPRSCKASSNEVAVGLAS